ncbi:hypothetical protein AX17_004301 [Amanita inopinata Kibby_2008]|nr:hypothetical protein AX17_004301 [Amanita inopinata Kibby_2008]
MSSDFPPQIQLRLPPSSTSFKRTFEEYGFDLASPTSSTDGAGSSGSLSNGNERNKRPRSASSLSDGNNSPASSQSSSSSSSNYSHVSQNQAPARPSPPAAPHDAAHVASSSTRPFHEIPRLPSPDIQDIEILDYIATDTPPAASQSHPPVASPTATQPNERLRLSLERFNAFDSEIAVLRGSPSIPPLAARTVTPPPTLPPLTLSDDQPDLSAATLPFLHPEHRVDASISSSLVVESDSAGSNQGDAEMQSHDDAVSDAVDVDAQPFLHIDPRLRPAQRSENPLSLPLSENSMAHTAPEASTWTQSTPTTTESSMAGLEFNVIRDRLDSALEPLRSSSPLLPDLEDLRTSVSSGRQSRANAPTLPPLRMQLQYASMWDDIPYRLAERLFGSPTPNHDERAGYTDEDRPYPSSGNVASQRSQVRRYWDDMPYRSMMAGESITQSHRAPTDNFSAENPSGAPVVGRSPPFLPVAYGAVSEPNTIPGESRNSTQHLSSASSESLPTSRSSLEGYLPSAEEWVPVARRRSAWRPLESEDDERLSHETRRLRVFPERHIPSVAARPGSLLESAEQRPWFGERSRPLPSRPPASLLRPNPGRLERNSFGEVGYAPPLWDDADSDRFSGTTEESDNWSRMDGYYSRRVREDLAQRLDRMMENTGVDYDSTRPSLSRSNTTTSAFAAMNRLRHRLHHSTSTRFSSSNSLVAENSAELRRRSAEQEWAERWPRLNNDRTQSPNEPHPSRPTLAELSSISDNPRRPSLRAETSSFERRLFGSDDGFGEIRRPSAPDIVNFESDRDSEPSFPFLHRRAASLSRPSSLWNPATTRRSDSPDQPHPIHSPPEPARPPGSADPTIIQFINGYFVEVEGTDVPSRGSEEPSTHRATRDPPRIDWLSRRRQSNRLPPLTSTSASPTYSNLWGEFDRPAVDVERSSEVGRVPGLGIRSEIPTQSERVSMGAAFRSSLGRHSRSEENPRLSSVRPRSPYLIDVPPLPSPDLSELFDNVTHFPQVNAREERLVPARPLPELSSRSFHRRRSSTPPTVPTRSQADQPTARTTGFENIDPNLFAPGPYRNTFQSLQRSRDQSPPPPSRPPVIPPLSFEMNAHRDTFENRHLLYPRPIDARSTVPHRASDDHGEPRSAFSRLGPSARRPAVYVPSEWDRSSPNSLTPEEQRHRQQPSESNLYAYLSRQARSAGTRIPEWVSFIDGPGNVSRFNHAVEVLRGEGLSRRQSFDRPPSGFRANMDGSRERSSSDWLAAHHHQYIRPRRMRTSRRVRPLGDYMRDEDFDESYESLLSLAAAIGDAKPRCTPEEIISKLETAMYKDWATSDSDKRCPICLDDYGPTDAIMKVGDCAHWLHKDCLHQWLKGANTCPVCRMVVHSPRMRSSNRQQRGEPSSNNSGGGNFNRRDDSVANTQNAANVQPSNTEASASFPWHRPHNAGWSNWGFYH